MSEDASTRDDESTAIAYVCEHWNELSTWLAQDDQTLLSRLGEALRAGREVSQLLDELHQAVQRGGDALGIYGNVERGQRAGLPRSGLGSPRPVEVIFVCPGGRCSRYATPETEGADHKPRCEIFGIPLRWERL